MLYDFLHDLSAQQCNKKENMTAVCAVFTIEPFFLPDDTTNAPGVRADYSSLKKKFKIMWSQTVRQTEKKKTQTIAQ